MKKNTTISGKIALLILLLLAINCSYAQVRIGPPSGTLDGSSTLEVESGPYSIGSLFRGFLPPIVNTNQRGTILNPATGLLLFNSTSNQIEVNTGTPSAPVWTAGGAVSVSGNNYWSLSGNSGTTSNNFLGTTDLVALNFRINNQRAGLIDPSKYNVAFGFPTLNTGATGTGNTALGAFTLPFQNSNADFNTAVGYRSMYTNTSGHYNVGLGSFALEVNTTGHDNTSLGHISMRANTTGAYNTGVGVGALASNTTADQNTALGANSAGKTTTGYGNTALGTDALATNTTGYDNLAVGASALGFSTTGFANTSVGTLSMFANTTGSFNVALGDVAGQYNTTGRFNTFLGTNSGPAMGNGNFTNSTAVGSAAIITGSNMVVLGDNQITSLRCAVQTISTLSDKRIKEDIKADVPGLSFITKLTPVTYHINKFKEAQLVGYPLKNDYEDKVLHSGFLAQDVEAAAKAVGYNFEGVRQEEGGKYYTVGYTIFVMPLVQAVKDLHGEVEKLKTKVQEGEAAYNQLAMQVRQMQVLLGELKAEKNAEVSRK